MTWDLDLGRPKRARQPYFTQDQLRQIIEGAPARYRALFAVLAATGLRIGEAAGLHVDDLDLDNGVIYVRRSVWNGQELEPKTDNAVREIDIDPTLVALLREHIGSTRSMRVFELRTDRRYPPATFAGECFSRFSNSSEFRRRVYTRSGIRE